MDLAPALRSAILAYAPIASQLAAYENSKAVFTRRPTPDDVDFPLIVVSEDIAIGNTDGVNDLRPVVIRDVSVYGSNADPAQYRVVEQIGYSLRTLFHRHPEVIVLTGWKVVSVVATGPRPAPVDYEQDVGRRVELSIQLARKN